MSMNVVAPPSSTQEEEGEGGGGLSPSWVLLDKAAYISADSVINSTTAVAKMSTGKSIHFSLCLGRPPLQSYLCAHFPGTVFGPAVGTPNVRSVRVPPIVLSTHADLALLRVTIPGVPEAEINDDSSFDYFVYTARPRPGASSLDLILHQPERDRVLPIPDSATELVFHNTSKVVLLGSTTVGWVDIWRGFLFCDVLDENPVLRDMPLPKPARSNRRSFCVGSSFDQRDITVLTIQEEMKIKYVEMATRPGVRTSRQCQQPMDHSGSGSGSCSCSDSEDDIDVADYWTATVWSMPVPVTSWKDWHKDCTIDVANTIVQNPRHSEVLLALPTRLSTDPEDAAVSLRRLCTGFPTLGLGMDGNLAIYFLSKVDCFSPEGWMIEVGIEDNKLHGIARLDDRKNSSFRRYYCISDISKYLIRATGAKGVLIRNKMPNSRNNSRNRSRWT